MSTATIELSGTGAIYMRVSTDKQDADRQAESTQKWCERHGVKVRPEHVYEDIGWARRDAATRPDFQRLMGDVKERRIQWVVIDRQDRFEGKDKIEFFHYLHLLREDRCDLYTSDDTKLTDPETVASLKTMLASDQSERELKEKSVRVLSGKIELAKSAQWMGGKVPYGMDVVAMKLTTGGELIPQWRVSVVRSDLMIKVERDGTRREYLKWPASERDEILQLRPTLDASKLDIVKRIYQTFANERTTPSTIANQLQLEGVEPPPYSTQWRSAHVEEILRRPTYIGRPAWNRYTRGAYHEFSGGQRREKLHDAKGRRHERADWIMPAEAIFPPVIAPELWQKVQDKLDAKPHQPRASRNHGYLFSGLMVCGNCGGQMTGSKMPSKTKALADRTLTYLCGTYNRFSGDRKKCPCMAYRVEQQVVEQYVRTWLDDTGEVVREFDAATTTQKPARLEQAIGRAVQAYKAMVKRIGGNVCILDGQRMIAIPLDANGDVLTHVPEVNWEAVADYYQSTYRNDREQYQHLHDELETEHTELTMAWKDLPTARAKQKAGARLLEMEDELKDIEAKLIDASGDMRAAVNEANAMGKAWTEATEALAAEATSRRRADAIRKVVGKITVTFQPTGRAAPVGEVRKIQIEAVESFTQSSSLMRSQ